MRTTLSILDRNRDQLLDANELGAETVARLDANKDGRVSERELVAKNDTRINAAIVRFERGVAHEAKADEVEEKARMIGFISGVGGGAAIVTVAITLMLLVSGMFFWLLLPLIPLAIGSGFVAGAIAKKHEQTIAKEETTAAREELKQAWHEVANVGPLPPKPRGL